MNRKKDINHVLALTFIKYSIFLLIGELLSWWILFHSSVDIPEYIPGTPVRISGLIRMALYVSVLIFGQKEFFKAEPELSLFKLTLLGTLICFTAEVFFQAANQFPLMGQTFSYRMGLYFRGLLFMTIFSAFLSFFVAFQLKTKKTNLLILMIIGFMLLTNLIK